MDHGKTGGVDVLIVEDDDDLRASQAEVLRSEGYSVVEANDSLVALAQLEHFDVASMIVDIYLPDVSGLWLLDQLENPPPVVLVTARDCDSEVAARRQKFFSYLQKPVRPALLLDAVSRALQLGERRARDQR